MAERHWPADQPVLELPEFWGAGVPSAAEIQAARELIGSLRGGPLLETRIPSVDPEAWLARFFAPVDEFERVEERPLGASWRLDPVLAFNRFLAAQAPVGVRFLPIEEDVQ